MRMSVLTLACCVLAPCLARADEPALPKPGPEHEALKKCVGEWDATVDVSLAVHNDSVRLRVADRGLGIDRDDLPHIFKPFYRGRRAVDAQIRGTGVGLSVVRHVIDAHRGTIHVESQPGEGTVVTVDLPSGPSINTGE